MYHPFKLIYTFVYVCCNFVNIDISLYAAVGSFSYLYIHMQMFSLSITSVRAVKVRDVCEVCERLLPLHVEPST